MLKGSLIAISLIGTDESLFQKIEIRKIGSCIAIDKREKILDCLSSLSLLCVQ